jgi:hypothetical protein
MLEADVVRLALGPMFLICLAVIFYLRKRKAARLLMAIGCLHVLGGVWLGREYLARIGREGFFGEADSALGRIPSRTERELVFWFLLWGVFAFLLGQLLSWAETQGKRPPAYFGWELMLISLAAAALAPKDGFWLVLIPAFMLAGSSKGSEANAAKSVE